MIHPIWFIWLFVNTVFSIAGAALLGNQYQDTILAQLPFFAVVMNCGFILYCYIGSYDKIRTSKKELKEER